MHLTLKVNIGITSLKCELVIVMYICHKVNDIQHFEKPDSFLFLIKLFVDFVWYCRNSNDFCSVFHTALSVIVCSA